MCKQWQSNCIAENPNDPSAQQQCRSTSCGSEQASVLALPSASVPSLSSSTVGETSVFTPSQTTLNRSVDSNTSSATRVSDTTSATKTSTTTPISPLDTLGGIGNNTFAGTGSESSENIELSAGAKAGISVAAVIGILLMVLEFFRLRRGAKRKALAGSVAREPHKPSDEKQVVVPVSSEISQKPELHDGSTLGYTPELHSEPAVGHRSNYSHPYPSAGEWQQSPVELDHSGREANELLGSEYTGPLEARRASPCIRMCNAASRASTHARATTADIRNSADTFGGGNRGAGGRGKKDRCRNGRSSANEGAAGAEVCDTEEVEGCAACTADLTQLEPSSHHNSMKSRASRRNTAWSIRCHIQRSAHFRVLLVESSSSSTAQPLGLLDCGALSIRYTNGDWTATRGCRHASSTRPRNGRRVRARFCWALWRPSALRLDCNYVLPACSRRSTVVSPLSI